MTNFDGKDLEKARVSAGMSRQQAAMLCCVSDRTIARWENNDVVPTPDDVDRLEKAYKAPGLWHNWMVFHFDSYAERFPAVEAGNVTAAVMNLRHQAKDVKKLQDDLERDALSGAIDNPALRRRFGKEAGELIAALCECLNMIDVDGDSNGR